MMYLVRPWDDRRARLYAADCAARVLHLYERRYPEDHRPRRAIDATRQFARGEIWDAARAAARAASASARAAARAAQARTLRTLILLDLDGYDVLRGELGKPIPRRVDYGVPMSGSVAHQVCADMRDEARAALKGSTDG